MDGTASSPSASLRLLSIDQCRGFAIIMMLLGNFLAIYQFTPWLLQHHPYGMSLAETIAPLFIFLVGMSYRPSFMRRMDRSGLREARRIAFRRYCILIGIGFIVYIDHLWGALTHIGMSGLLCLPIIHRGTQVRLAAAAAFLALYQVLYYTTGYEAWVMGFGYSLNGGPLAALSWGSILCMGTVAWDMLAVRTPERILRDFWLAGVALIGLGLLLSLRWPGIKPAWPFSRWGMTAPLPVLTCGIAFIVYDFWYMLNEKYRIELPLFTPLGRNPFLIFLVVGFLVGASRIFTWTFGEPTALIAMISYGAMVIFTYFAALYLDRKQVLFRF